MNRKKAYTGIVIVLLMLLVFTVKIPPVVPDQIEKSQFALASWNYPDEYGQGIEGLKFYENSTGSWVAAPYYTDIGPFYFLNYYEIDYTLNWSPGVAMKLRVYTVLNSTLTGATSEADGQNYQQHSITVTNLGSVIFSQQNFTYYDAGTVADLVFYEYEVVLEFLPVSGLIYVVTVIYEVFY